MCRTGRDGGACAHAATLLRARAKTTAEREMAAGLALLGCETESRDAAKACAVVEKMVKAREVPTSAIDARGYVARPGCKLGQVATCSGAK
jgi:hypothetical protein